MYMELRSVPGWWRRRGLVGLGFVSSLPKQFSTGVPGVASKNNPSGFVPGNW